MKLKLFFILIASVFCMSIALGQGTSLPIGTSTSNSGNAPVSLAHSFGKTQIIYLASEIEAIQTSGKSIISLEFAAKNTFQTQSKTVKVYLANISETVFANATTYISAPSKTLVFDGSVNMIMGEKIFSTPFTEAGFIPTAGSNLLVEIVMEDAEKLSANPFYYTATASDALLCLMGVSDISLVDAVAAAIQNPGEYKVETCGDCGGWGNDGSGSCGPCGSTGEIGEAKPATNARPNAKLIYGDFVVSKSSLSASKSFVDFKDVKQASSKIKDTIIVKNTGYAESNFSIEIPSNSKITLLTEPKSLAPNAEIKLVFEYNPATIGYETNLVSITPTDGGTAAEITLTANTYSNAAEVYFTDFEEEYTQDLPPYFNQNKNNYFISEDKTDSYSGIHRLGILYSQDTLILPRMDGGEGKSLWFRATPRWAPRDVKFQVLYSDVTKNTWTEYPNTDNIVSTLIEDEYVYVNIDLADLPAKGYIAFVAQQMYIDNLGFSVKNFPDYDYAITKIEVPEEGVATKPMEIPIDVKTLGSQKGNFTLSIMDGTTNTSLFDTLITTANQGGLYEIKTHTITLKNPDAATTSIYAKVVMQNTANIDEVQKDNVSAKMPTSIQPYISELFVEDDDLYVNYGTVVLDDNQQAITKKITLENKGFKPLEITALTSSLNVYSLQESLPITIPVATQGRYGIVNGEVDVNIKFDPTQAGVQSSSLEFVHTEASELRISVIGAAISETTHFETFEAEVFPPMYWKTLPKNTNWERNGYRGFNGAAADLDSPDSDTLITPMIKSIEGDKLVFQVRFSSYSDVDSLEIIYSADLETWTSISKIENLEITYQMKEVALPIGQYYIGFVGKEEVEIDEITLPEVVYLVNDAELLSFEAPQTANKNYPINITTVVRNLGSTVINTYDIELRNGSDVLATHNVSGKTIERLSNDTAKMIFTPSEEINYTNLQLHIVFNNDEDVKNNVSSTFGLMVKPESSRVGLIGVIDENSTANDAVWHTNYNYGLYQHLFLKEELGISASSEINSIEFYYNPASSDDAKYKHILKVWIGETDSTDFDAEKWIEAKDLTKVFEDSINTDLTTDGILRLDLDSVYKYKGGNIVILVEKPKAKYGSVSFYKNTGETNRTLYYHSDTPILPEIDPTQDISILAGGTNKDFPTTAFSYKVPEFIVTGTVVDDLEQVVSGATVNLSVDPISYTTTTDTDGKFYIQTSQAGKDFTLSVSYLDYIHTPQTVSIGSTEDTVKIGKIQLASKVFEYKLTVQSNNSKAIDGAIITLKSLKSINTYRDTIKGEVDVYTQTFVDLAKGSYEIEIAREKDFLSILDTFTISTENLEESFTMQAWEAQTFSSNILNARDETPINGALVEFVCLDPKADTTYTATTDAAGAYSITTALMDRNYTMKVSHRSFDAEEKEVMLKYSATPVILDTVKLVEKNIIYKLTVLTEDNASSEGAVVTLTPKSASEALYTTVVGEELSGIALLDAIIPDAYILNISFPNYLTITDSVDLTESRLKDTVVLKIENTQKDIVFNVETSSGIVPNGAVINMTNDLGFTYDITLTNNTHTFEDVTAGKYTYNVFFAGYETFFGELTIKAATTMVDVILQEIIISPFALNAEVVYSEESGKADINFKWNDSPLYFFDSYEDYDDFSIEFSPWTLIDIDQLGTASFSVEYANRGGKMAAMIVNPYATEPALSDPAAAPLSGNKYMCFFNSVGGANNDWAISPKFMIRSGDSLMFALRQLMTSSSAQESYRVGVSTTGTNPEDFVFLHDNYFTANASNWQLFTSPLEAFVGQEIYVGINCASNTTGSGLKIDDFFIGQLPEETKGMSILSHIKALNSDGVQYYKIYHNDVLVDSVSDKTEYIFENASVGEHKIGVSAVYISETTPIISTTVTVENYEEIASALTLNITTNANEIAGGAKVTLTNSEEEVKEYTVLENKLHIAFIENDTYTMTIEKSGFNIIEEEIELTQDLIKDYMLIEIKSTPGGVGLVINEKGNNIFDVEFLWNQNAETAENFESIEDFSMLIPNWKVLDLDGKPAFGVSTCDFPNENEPSAGLVFNPKTTTPAIDGDMLMKAHSGDKYWMFRSAAEETNDWLISPKIIIGNSSVVKFWAKSYTDMYGLESLNIKISESGSMPEDFKDLKTLTSIPTDWTKFSVDLSQYKEKEVYIALQYATIDKFMLFVDDIYIGANDVADTSVLNRVIEYNVYLGEDLKNTQTEKTYTFENLAAGTYRAGVEAVYASGVSEKLIHEFTLQGVSNSANIDAIAINMYPNPLNGVALNIESDVEIEEIRIFGVNGCKVFSSRVNGASSVELKPNLLAGIYFVEILASNGNRCVKKLIVR